MSLKKETAIQDRLLETNLDHTELGQHPPYPAGSSLIQPARGWVGVDLRELWRYRELIYFLTWRDIKIRYKQTTLGAGWAIIQPIVNTIIFTVIFGRAAHFPSNGLPYPIFTFTALLPWTYFAYVLQQSGTSVITNANMLSKVYFPRLVLPLSAALAGLVDFGLALVVLIGMMLWYHVHPGIQILLLPAFLLLAMVTALGVGIWLAALSAEYRDVRYILPFLTQVWLYASPVAYAASLVTGKLAVVYALNPMAGVIEGFRWALLGVGGLPGRSLLISVAISALLLIGGVLYFSRMEQSFADII
jgi:lipopolysaccharide transport system permease protein